MSLVGTRPILPDELEQYELHHRARIAIKPGITGMWQVSGRSDITDFEEIVRLDTEYISEWNIGLDIKILFKGSFIMLFVFDYNVRRIQEALDNGCGYDIPGSFAAWLRAIRSRCTLFLCRVSGMTLEALTAMNM